MGLEESLVRLEFEPDTNVYDLDEGTVKEHYRGQSKKLHPDHNAATEEDFKKLTEAYQIVIKIVKNNKNKPSPKFIAEYEYYKARFDALKALNKIKYYPTLSTKRYLELYAEARKKKLELGGKGLELYQIIEQYCTGQESRDLKNRHLGISFEQYFALYIRYYGVIDLEKYIDEYAGIKKQSTLFNIDFISAHLNKFLRSKIEKGRQQVK